MKKILMARGADKVVSTCVKVQPEEEVVIITEESKMQIAEAVAAAVYRVGAHPVLTIMEPRAQDSQEPPRVIAAAMKCSDAFISIVGKSITHTHAVKDAVQNGSRGVVLTQFSEDMMIHGQLENLKKGDPQVNFFLIISSIVVVLQNLLGVGLSKLMGIDPLIGLANANTIALAAATFGLVAGSLFINLINTFVITGFINFVK